MGVKTKLSLNQINLLIKDTNIVINSIKETTNGLSDTTYILSDLNNKYIFKLYENSSMNDIQEEVKILHSLKELKVARVLSDVKILLNKPAVLYSYITGDISKDINIKQIQEVSAFLSSLHNINSYKAKNKNIYDKKHLNKMYEKITKNEEFLSKYKFIKDLDLKEDCLIHGDLFPDNVKFINNTFSGAYDFAHSCYGNSFFDLAVCIVSWCFSKNYEFSFDFFTMFLKTYNKNRAKNITKEFLKPYLLYACFYYALQRFLRENTKKGYYKEYIKKFDIILEII